MATSCNISAMLSNFLKFNVTKLCVVVCHFLLFVSAFAQTPGYQKITWDDLLNEEWYQQMKKEMGTYGRMAFLKDGSEEAEKLMASMRSKLDEAPISTKYINQKIRMPGFVVPLDAVRNGQREFFIGAIFWRMHSYTSSASQSNRIGHTASQTQLVKNTGVDGCDLGGGPTEGGQNQNGLGRVWLHFRGS